MEMVTLYAFPSNGFHFSHTMLIAFDMKLLGEGLLAQLPSSGKGDYNRTA
jgi:hypothetical protein